VARAPLPDDVRADAADAADAALAGLNGRWNPDGRFPSGRALRAAMTARTRARSRLRAPRPTEYAAALRDERNGSVPTAVRLRIDTTPAAADVDFDAFLDRVTTHVLTTIGELRRETADVEGLVRFWGDDWRTAEQGAAKVWSIATLAAELGGLIRERDGDAADLFSAARPLRAV